MPIYEYTCTACGAEFEDLVMSQAEAANVHCPECASTKVAKGLSAFAVGAASSQSELPCDSGACKTPTCAGGSCPFSQ